MGCAALARRDDAAGSLDYPPRCALRDERLGAARRAHAREEEQRGQRGVARRTRARSAVPQMVKVIVGTNASVHQVWPAQASGQLRFLGSMSITWPDGRSLRRAACTRPLWPARSTMKQGRSRAPPSAAHRRCGCARPCARAGESRTACRRPRRCRWESAARRRAGTGWRSASAHGRARCRRRPGCRSRGG